MAGTPLYGRFLVSRVLGVPETNTTAVALDIPAGSYIPPKGVSVIITTGLDGGTPSIDIGDLDNDDGWVDTTDITETSAGTYSGLAANTAAYSDTGRYYASANQITAKIATGLTAGAFYVVAQVLDLADPV
jgi:hypothetical protein